MFKIKIRRTYLIKIKIQYRHWDVSVYQRLTINSHAWKTGRYLEVLL